MRVKPHQLGLLNRLGKRVAPFFSRIFMRNSFAEVTALLEAYIAFVQGKGSGTGWDMEGEVRVSVSHIHRTDAIIFDVGANKGEWSFRLLEALGSKCHIFQFEPSQHCHSILRSRNCPQITLIEAAVGDKQAMATLYSPELASPIASLHPRRDSYFQQRKYTKEKVEVVTIDDIIDEFKIDKIDFIKMDIEGNELAALRGARKALESKCIKAMTFEFGSANLNSRTYFHDFWDFLKPYGYTIKRICPGGILVKIEEYYEDLEYFRGVSNYLAVLE